MDSIILAYDKSSRYIKRISSSSVRGETKNFLLKYPIIAKPCHYDPLFFQQINIYHTLQIASGRNFGSVDLVSIWMATTYTPHCTYYFYVAAETLLSNNGSYISHRGPELGLQIIKMMAEVEKQFKAQRYFLSSISWFENNGCC